MFGKRFSVFISSTFEDLRDERQAVQDAIISAGDFPVQMENFPAADEDQLDFIYSLIDQCDYYVLIIGGRYGSIGPDGLSYTEKEYRYAKERKIPILVMLHGDQGNIPASKLEGTDLGRKKLEAFIESVSDGRLRARWTSTGELKHAVRDALDHAKATRPATGWVRTPVVASEDILRELNEVRKENDVLRASMTALSVEFEIPKLPAANVETEIQLLPLTRTNRNSVQSATPAKVVATWSDVFPLFFDFLRWSFNEYEGTYYVDDESSVVSIGSALAGELSDFNVSGFYEISVGTLRKLEGYFIESGLMLEQGPSPFSEIGRKIARRNRIIGTQQSVRLVSGKVSVLEQEKGGYGAINDMDAEIPF